MIIKYLFTGIVFNLARFVAIVAIGIFYMAKAGEHFEYVWTGHHDICVTNNEIKLGIWLNVVLWPMLIPCDIVAISEMNARYHEVKSLIKKAQ